MSYIKNLIDDTDKTHPNLGNLVAVSQIVVKARKMMMIVSPSGCGKSRALEYIGKKVPNSFRPQSISIAGLANKTEMLTSFRSVIVIDDIANIQTTHGRNATINTLSALCYSHRVQPSMFKMEFCIEDFYGSALIGIQPVLLKELMLSSVWEASIQDKSLRYYHLYRPLQPNTELPNTSFNMGIDFDSVENFEPNTISKLWPKLLELGYYQWSRARCHEHMKDLLKAVASLENRKNIIEDDYKTLLMLLKPMSMENLAIKKDELEGDRFLDNNLLALLAEYFSYNGEFTLAHVALDFKISLSQAYRIMQKQTNSHGNWQQISKSPTIYKPNKNLIHALKLINYEAKK